MTTPLFHLAACYGVGCIQHDRCTRFLAVDDWQGRFIGTCDPGDNTRPGFLKGNDDTLHPGIDDAPPATIL